MSRWLGVAGLLLVPSLAQADVVTLVGGGELRGVVLERRAHAVVMEVGPGIVTVPMARVVRITGGGNELSQYRARALAIRGRDSEAWVALGEWARDQGLHTQSTEAFRAALALDPDHAGAHRGLGHVRVGAQWLTDEQAYRARGYEQFEGRWVGKEERRALAEERAAESSRRAETAESEARIREAEARARAAEADARRAEAEVLAAREAAPVDGIPYPWVLGGMPGYGPSYGPIYGPVLSPAPEPPVVVVVRPERTRPPARDHGSTPNTREGRSGRRGAHPHPRGAENH